MNRLARTFGLALLVGLLFLGLLFVQSQAGTSTNDLVMQTLSAQGFSNIDFSRTVANAICQSGEQGYAFTAVNGNGQPVQGIVCARNSLVGRHAYITYR
jgi:hypothetical protein